MGGQEEALVDGLARVQEKGSAGVRTRLRARRKAAYRTGQRSKGQSEENLKRDRNGVQAKGRARRIAGEGRKKNGRKWYNGRAVACWRAGQDR